MKILLTGANGYIGSRLLPLLLENGHEVIAMVRHSSGFSLPYSHSNLSIIYVDLLEPTSLEAIPLDIDIAFYLVHSMSYSNTNFPELEKNSALNFLKKMKEIHVRQIIYLSGFSSDMNLSPHLKSRYNVELLIKQSGLPFTILRAGIIIGTGSASFEIIRDLTEKLPVMVAPKWVNNLCQPIAIQDVLDYLLKIINHPDCINRVFDIGGPDLLSYKDMLLIYAEIRKLKRYIFVVPVLTPKLSSYWLYFITSVNFQLASSLVDSVKNIAICSESSIKNIFPNSCLNYRESIEKALDIIEQNPLIPSWKDSLMTGAIESNFSNLVQAPIKGCLVDKQIVKSSVSAEKVIATVWSVGGSNGWFYMNWAWGLRGFLDKLFGGVGLQRGRTHPNDLQAGSCLDFWRVLVSDKKQGHLLLYAEMKIPGEAWLEFKVQPCEGGSELIQTATFRPKGLLGRLYWYVMFPMHFFLFKGMANSIISHAKEKL